LPFPHLWECFWITSFVHPPTINYEACRMVIASWDYFISHTT
jgi:hypothetical protein